jgi:hypothetical protein
MEKKMVELLVELKENHHVSGVKAEFETEGTRLEEAMRLKEISLKAGLGMNLKIGGCEAIKDMFDAIRLGVERTIAPMVESAYALKKYLKAATFVFGNHRENDVEFLINVETITAFRNFEEMLQIPEIKSLSGIVIGRSDLSSSMGIAREDIDGPEVLDIALEIARKAKSAGLSVTVGGGVSVHSLSFLNAFPDGHLDRFETRKVIFERPGVSRDPESALRKAIEFELLWLKNKKNYYGAIYHEDDARLETIEKYHRASVAG